MPESTKRFDRIEIHVELSEEKPRDILVSARPIVDQFSAWFHEKTDSPLTRSEKEMLKMFVLWLGKEDESSVGSTD